MEKPGSSEQPANETIYYFDTFSGQLLVGAEAVGAHIEAGGNPSDIQELGVYLRSSNGQTPSEHRLALDTSGWTSEDFLASAQWLSTLPRRLDEAPLTQSVLARAGQLGVSPGIRKYVVRFGNLANIYDLLKLEGVRRRGYYRDWTRAMFINYVRNEIDLGLTSGIYKGLRAKSQKGEGPSPDLMMNTLGVSIVELAELTGYVFNSINWDENQFIEWGVKTMLANDGAVIKYSMVNTLSAKRRGPSRFTINKLFGNLFNFQAAVINAYESELEFRSEQRACILENIEKGLVSQDISSDLFNDVVGEDEMIRVYSKYRVVNELFPNLADGEKREIALRKTPEGFVSSLIRLSPALTAGEIEMTALELDVFDDIWPMDDYMKYLRVVD